MIKFFMVMFLGFIEPSTVSLQDDCAILKEGKFHCVNTADATEFFVIENDLHTEYFQDGKYWIKSKVEWLDDCSYKLTLVDKFFPGFIGKKGDVMINTIYKIEHDTIYGESQMQELTFKFKTIKLKK